MDKTKLAKQVRDVTGFTYQEAKLAVDATFDVMAEALRQGEQVRIANWITLDVEMRKPKEAYDFHSGERKVYPAKRVVKAKVGAELARIVSGE